jgi:hypothetical protein
VKQLKDVDDDTVYVLSKVLKHEKETKELLGCIEPDFN